jgi:ribose 5-phosphate isomerase B
MTNIAIASDHRGLKLKNHIIDYLSQYQYHVHDFGCFTDESVDYPEFAKLVTNSVASNQFNVGILICSSGIGMSIAANRNPKIRAVLCSNSEYAKMARLHNDANVIIFGADFISVEEAIESLKIFFSTKFEGGRHQQRLDKLS